VAREFRRLNLDVKRTIKTIEVKYWTELNSKGQIVVINKIIGLAFKDENNAIIAAMSTCICLLYEQVYTTIIPKGHEIIGLSF